MVAVGYASLPITPSLRGVQSAINSALKAGCFHHGEEPH